MEAREREPQSAVAAFYLGLARKQLGDYHEAARHFRDALYFRPRVKDAFVELIEVLYRMEELEEARQWIHRAEIRDVQPAQVAFLKGLIYLKEEKTDKAIESFKTAKHLDESLAQSAKMQISMAHAEQRRLKAARNALDALIGTDPDTEVASFAEEYRDSIRRALEAHKTWNFKLAIGYRYDSNVVSKPSETIGVSAVDDITDEEDSVITKSIRGDYSPFIDGPWSLNTRLQLQANTHFDNTDYNVLSPTLTVRPARSTGRGSFSLPVRHSHVWLGGHEYTGLSTARPTLSVEIIEGHTGRLSAGYTRREMQRYPDNPAPEEDRDGNIYSLSAGYVYPFAEGAGMFNAGYEYTRENTDGRNWDSDGHRLNTGVVVPVTEKLNATLSGSVLYREHRNRHEIFGDPPYGRSGYPDSPRKRRDTVYRASTGLSYDITESLGLTFNYSHIRNESNFPIYDYRRNQYNAGMEYRF